MDTPKHQNLNDLKTLKNQDIPPKAVESLGLNHPSIDLELLTMMEKRFTEAQQCIDVSPLATIVLCGSIIEGLLYAEASRRCEDFNRSNCAPKDKEGRVMRISHWTLENLINVACDVDFFCKNTKDHINYVKTYRNFIHPREQLESQVNVNSDLAKLCIQSVLLLVGDINRRVNPKVEKDFCKPIRRTGDTYIALVVLIGNWNSNNEHDREAVATLLGITYGEWEKQAQEIRNNADSPLSYKDGAWSVINRTEIWEQFGMRIIDSDLEVYQSLAISVLKESDPAFDLPVKERWTAGIYGKVFKYSPELRKGIAEGLAILGCRKDVLVNCKDKNKKISQNVIRELLNNADWVLWGSLNYLLPILAEADPNQFLHATNKAMALKPVPFDALFSQEGDIFIGGNYLTGLLWALEGLAWESQYLVRVCVALAELASRDPGGRSGNRPSNSLVTILLPWLPQTEATFDTRKTALETILKEQPDIAWNVIIKLLPRWNQFSSGSHRPSWRKISDDENPQVSYEEYWKQVSFYAERALACAGRDVARLAVLIDHLHKLPLSVFDQFLEKLSSLAVSEEDEQNRFSIWDHLTGFISKQKKFSDQEWALSNDQIVRIENVADKLAPTDPFYRYQHLFSDRYFDLYESQEDWRLEQEKRDARCWEAMSEIIDKHGIEGAIRFAEIVHHPQQVGISITLSVNSDVEKALLPHFLDSTDVSHRGVACAFIRKRVYVEGVAWCDAISRESWTPVQSANFLAYLPFRKSTWDRAAKWLQVHESEYWSRVDVNEFQAEDDFTFAIDKLIEHRRPCAAIKCLVRALYSKQLSDTRQSVQALLAVPSSSEPRHVVDSHAIVELIKYIQSDPSIDERDLFNVEWVYVQVLRDHRDISPKLIETKLANDPQFFCEVIRLVYPSEKEDQSSKQAYEKSQEIIDNALSLLEVWRTVPGTQRDGAFNEVRFIEWIQQVKKIFEESAHLDFVLNQVGSVLIYAPSDSNGLWINCAVAEALNERDADSMREGFRTEILKSRGIYKVDPTGEPERKLAEKFRNQAKELESNTFHRFADTLRGLAEIYDNKAGLIVSKHQI